MSKYIVWLSIIRFLLTQTLCSIALRISYSNWTEWSTIQGVIIIGRVINFKSAERVAQGQFEITSTITPELYDTKFKC